MGSEDDLVADLLKIGVTLFPQEFKRYEARMSLVQMEGLHVPVTKVAEYPESAYAQYKFLAQAVSVVASVQFVRQRPVLGGVLGEVRIEKEYRDGVPGIPDYGIGPYPTFTSLWFIVMLTRLGGKSAVLRVPVTGLDLSSSSFIFCAKYPFIEEGDPHHRNAKVGSALEYVAGQYPSPPE